MNELLTPDEHEAVALAGRLYTLMAKKVIGYGPTRGADLAELTALIHGVQHIATSQAAARAYPDLYRLQGGLVGVPPAPSGDLAESG
jgi:hypothetical protein